jgi:hypothetical protein
MSFASTKFQWLESQGYFEIMKYRRSHESAAEAVFIQNVLIPELEKHGKYQVDKAGNFSIRIGTKYDTLFSAHIDTMHNAIANKGNEQRLVIDEEKGLLYNGNSEVLGADDGSGIFLLFMLLRKKVPGLYIFHRGEERGGIGSSWIAKEVVKAPKIFKGIKKAVAFDRYKKSHVITHQAGRRCASEVFANALSDEFSTLMPGIQWAPNDGGSFTDTANYTTLIAECTNISVGYMHQHSPQEYQDLHFLQEQAQIIHLIKWNKLPAARDPKVIELPVWLNKLGHDKRVANKKAVPFRPERDEELWGTTPGEFTPEWIKAHASEMAEVLNAYCMDPATMLEDFDEMIHGYDEFTLN